MEEFVICAICGANKRELNSHISMHKMSTAEYKMLFPNEPIISPASSARKSAGVKETNKKNGKRILSVEAKAKISKASKKMHERHKQEDYDGWLERQRRTAALARQAKGEDYTHSEKTLEKMRGPRPQMTGRKLSDETKAKISAARTGKHYAPHSAETIDKMRAAWVRRKADKETYEAYIKGVSERLSTPEMIARFRNRTAELIKSGHHNGKSSDTKPERRFKRFLELKNIPYEHQYILRTEKGAFTFDFYIPSTNLLVEIDSFYYHTMCLEVWNRDRLKTKLATEMGFTVARISDKDWNPDIIFESGEAIVFHTGSLLAHHKAIIDQRGD